MKLTQQGHPITFKVKATLKKQGRTNPYTYTTDTLSLTINKSSRQLFDEME
ncbi:MAG: hypothetical protein MJ233_00940 [Mycoplasmoidaceae bacterium]|nr:hypothetical protein [Mycoplasmoidaceae bacterium]